MSDNSDLPPAHTPTPPALVRKGEEDWVLHLWRFSFFEFVHEECPEARESLIHDVGPAYQEIAAGIKGQYELGNLLTFGPGSFLKGTEQLHPEALDCYHEALDAWCDRFWLDADWTRETALVTLMAYFSGDDGAREAAEAGWVCRMGAFGQMRRKDWLQLRLPAWEPVLQQEKPWREHCLAIVEERLKAHAEQVRARLADVRELPRWPEAPEHLRWLARYQVGHENKTAIAADVGRERTSVRDALERAAEKIGLNLRPPDPPTPPPRSGVSAETP